MAMKSKGLVKLVEECGELTQVAAKRIAYPTGPHPDEYDEGRYEKPLNRRIEDEMGDVMAAIRFTAGKLGLDWTKIMQRSAEKHARFQEWDKPKRYRAFDLTGRVHPVKRSRSS